MGALGVLVLIWSTAFFAPGAALAQDNGSRVSIGEDLVIGQGETASGNVSVTNADLKVLGTVDGNAVVVNGSADIEGTVKGNVTVTGDDLKLGPHASIGGNAVGGGNIELAAGSSIGGNVAYLGQLERSPQANVGGQVVRMPSMPFDGLDKIAPPGVIPDAGGSEQWMYYSPFARTATFIGIGVFGLLLLLLGAIIAMVAPSRINISTATLESEPGPSIIVGFIVALLFFPVVAIVTVLLAITIVGAILTPLLAALGLLYGLVVISLWLGRRLYDTARRAPAYQAAPLVFDVLLGMAVVLGSTLVPAVFLPIPAAMLLLFLLYLVSCLGLGAAILSRFGTLTPPRRVTRYPGPTNGVPPSSPAASGVTTPLGPRPPLPGEQ